MAGNTPLFRWHELDRREVIVAGPRNSTILVGKPIGRELGELRSFAWQVFGSGGLVLALGLIGGWWISRSITRPIATIAETASAISASNLSRRIEMPGIDDEPV